VLASRTTGAAMTMLGYGAESPTYTATARVLHWITAALVLTMIPIGLIMANFSLGPTGDVLYDIHRSIGAVLIPIVLIRLAYRLANPPPPLPDDIPAIQRLAANLTHWALYILLMVQAFIGWIATSAYRAPIKVFWLFELPPIWPVDQPYSEKMFGVHRLIGITLALLICMHIGAALFHHFVRRDDVLLRMVGR
jgi:cytochrome b561